MKQRPRIYYTATQKDLMWVPTPLGMSLKTTKPLNRHRMEV